MSATDEEYKRKLIERYVAGEASEKELQAFFGLLTEAEIDSLIGEHMDQEILRLREEKGLIKPVKRLKIWKYVAAASIIAFISAGGYYIFHQQTPKDQFALDKLHDIKPGSNKAMLTLANGSQIPLTGAKNGILTTQGHTTITKAADGKVVYEADGNGKATEVAYNTITTPRGGQYQVVLPDGSQVWLNAASSITYPVAFNGHERKVTMTGEAYFEVIHNAAKPFRVVAGTQTIEDLGTHFDVNSYADEPVYRTTLIEGSVRVSLNATKTVKLLPGQQADVTANSNNLQVKPGDIDEAVAWKNGKFRFNDEQLGGIMRQVSRWYNVDVSYDDESLKNRTFAGITTRFGNVSELLHMLELTGEVKFKIEGRRIIVLNK